MKIAHVVALLWLAAAPVRSEVTVIPWAWERPEDLRFLQPGATVAWYAGILTLDGERVRVQPRRNPLQLAGKAHRIAVIRIETKRATLDAPQLEATLAAIRRLHRNAEELQLDFDATRSERAFYRALLVALREDLKGRAERAERRKRPVVTAPESSALRPRSSAHHRARLVVHRRPVAERAADRRSGADALPHGTRRTRGPCAPRRALP